MSENNYCITYFINCLNLLNVQGQKRKMWLTIFRKNPAKAGEMFYDKLEREYGDTQIWEQAKKLILEKRPELKKDTTERATRRTFEESPRLPEAEPIPEPEPEIIDFDYFLRRNKGSWGCCMYDIHEYEADTGIIIQ